MVFDTETQKKIVLELLDASTIPGKALDIMANFKREVLAATVKKESSND